MEVAKVSTQLPGQILNVPSDSLPVLAGSLEVEVSTIKIIASGVEKSIRRTEKAVIAVALPKMISYCAEVFCGAEFSEREEIVDECTEFVVSQFAGIGVPEIREAFKLAAAGKLGDIDLSAYRGVFTIKILGKILGNYMVFRVKAVREIMKAEQEAEAARLEAQKLEKLPEMLAKHADWCKSKIESYILDGAPRYDLIPVVLYEYLESLELVKLDRTTKLDLMERAKPLLRSSLVTDVNTENNEFRKKHIREIVAKADKGEFLDFFVARQKTVAKQLAVLDYITSQKQAYHANAVGTA